MISNKRNDLSFPWECNDQLDRLMAPSIHYFMVTIKNNTSPKKQYTDPNRYCAQANRLFLKGFSHIKSAFELDSKNQLHLHLILKHPKNINRVKMSQFLKQFENTFCHDIKPIETIDHYNNALAYLNPQSNQSAINRYIELWYPNDACDFLD